MLDEDELKEFETMMDLALTPVRIGDYEYPAGEALKCLDPIAFREEYLKWVNGRGGC